MPLGKYYCDYCEKQFQDTPSARKRHIQGLHHQRARALWYHSLNQIQSDGLCHRFIRTGFCQYGESCKYFHPNQNIPGGNQFAGGSSLQGNISRDGMGISLGNLPPSLRLPPEGGYPSLPFIDWG
ncbi:hypothetical protein Scep_008792 [Stephania cephalantha]|uniref:C3H1-type domain-containing protein n=1 Tax=Stephania cephalantha TaxID=152367 RepID=A0AAP0JSF4_9MAGN